MVTFSTEDDICAYYKCVATSGDASGASVPDVSDYAVVAITPSVDLPIGASLTTCLAVFRDKHEVEAIYVRPLEAGAFEPLYEGHLSYFGKWVVIGRRRRVGVDPRIVGIMLAKDEADVIPEVLGSITSILSRLYFHAVDEVTEVAILENSPLGWAISCPPLDGQKRTDGHRQVLLDYARADRGDDVRPMWIMNIQGDEIYDDDIAHHVRLAQIERATVMSAQVATFVLHESQREGWDWTLPLRQRLTHYVWDFGEHAGFLDFPWIYYDREEHMRAHPHGFYPSKYAAARPVRRHCPFRSPEQARARIEDRLKSGWQPHYKNYQDIFMDKEAAGRSVKRYFGWFPEAERVEGLW